MNQTTISLTEDDHLHAAQEGWDIFAVNSNEDEYQIQKADDDDKFVTDDEVWDFIINKAILGSEFHRKIIAFIKQSTPTEFNSFVKDAAVIDNSKETPERPWLLEFHNGEAVGFKDKVAANDALAFYRNAVSLDVAS
jgi:hypothetical protein